jgi:hypothetical protein
MGPVQSFPNHFSSESAGLRSRIGLAGGWRGWLIHVLVVGTFGVFLPWMRGIEFFDPVMLSAYACLGILFAAPAAAQAFAAERPSSMAEATARIAVAVIYGEVMVIAILMAGFATVYLSHTFLPIAPDLPGLAMANGFGLAASFAMSAVAGWIALKFSAVAARSAMRVMFLGLLVLFFFYSRWLPDVIGIGALVAVVVAAVALLGLRRLVA